MSIDEIQAKLDFINSELQKLKSEIEKNKFDYNAVFATKGRIRSINNTLYDLGELIERNREPDNDQEITEMPF